MCIARVPSKRRTIVTVTSVNSVATGEFAELRRLVVERNLLRKQPVYHWLKIGVNFAMLASAIAVLVLIPIFWIQLLNAAFLAFVFTQIAFIAHDTGHRQNLRTKIQNDCVGLLHGNFLIGMSYGWWVQKHDAHHAHPNQHGHDPDVEILVLAFDEEQARKKRGIARFIVKYQAYFFFPILLLQTFSMRYGSFEWLLKTKSKYCALEFALIALHFVWFLGLIFLNLPFWQGLACLAVHQGLFGLYLASVFAPNHKGMPLLEADTQMDFLRRQILTARNVRAHLLTDFWYGGLNYQIEHHLFPNMPRNHLRKAQKVVRDFCQQHEIKYYETSIVKSYKEILQNLHEVSAPLRQCLNAV